MGHMGDGWGWWTLLAMLMAVVWIAVIWVLVAAAHPIHERGPTST
jgi:hypothetical protein